MQSQSVQVETDLNYSALQLPMITLAYLNKLLLKILDILHCNGLRISQTTFVRDVLFRKKRSHSIGQFSD